MELVSKKHRYMFSNVVVKSVFAIRKQLHYVKLISKIHHNHNTGILITMYFTD